jgi:hypothetical protein
MFYNSWHIRCSGKYVVPMPDLTIDTASVNIVPKPDMTIDTASANIVPKPDLTIDTAFVPSIYNV